MNKTTLQFDSLVQLAAFIESKELVNFEINYNALTLRCDLESEVVGWAIANMHATVLEQEVLN